jgi:hypothetical protein
MSARARASASVLVALEALIGLVIFGVVPVVVLWAIALAVGVVAGLRSEVRRYRGHQDAYQRMTREQHQERAAQVILFPRTEVQGVQRRPPFDWADPESYRW